MKTLTCTKLCPKCKTAFSLHDLLSHPDIEPVGLSSDYGDPENCYFYFCHRKADCMTTLTVPLEFFRSVIVEEIPPESHRPAANCPRHCTTIADLRSCDCLCYQAPYRRLMLEMVKARETEPVR